MFLTDSRWKIWHRSKWSNRFSRSWVRRTQRSISTRLRPSYRSHFRITSMIYSQRRRTCSMSSMTTSLLTRMSKFTNRRRRITRVLGAPASCACIMQWLLTLQSSHPTKWWWLEAIVSIEATWVCRWWLITGNQVHFINCNRTIIVRLGFNSSNSSKSSSSIHTRKDRSRHYSSSSKISIHSLKFTDSLLLLPLFRVPLGHRTLLYSSHWLTEAIEANSLLHISLHHLVFNNKSSNSNHIPRTQVSIL